MIGTSTREDSLPLPERVGRYEVLLPIAAGGMAAVYLARARGVGGFEREVALKLTHAHLRATPEFATDLVDEAKLASRIRHPNVVQVLEVGEDPLGIYLLMDYIEGDSLAGLLRRGRAAGAPPLPIFVRILVDALAGLHAAHELCDDEGHPLGIVHRDFSPQNVLVGVDGMSRLADFGIARASTRVSHTRTGAVKGKISYMSPEQAKGEALDRRSDVWAAGVVAWEIFAGRRLYTSGDNDLATMLKIVTQEPPLLRAVQPDTPPDVEEAVASALALDAGSRCPSARELAQRLASAARAGCGIAEIDEVAAYVARVVGPKLAERRRKIAEVSKLRAEMERVVEARDPAARTPSSQQVAVVVPAVATAQLAAASEAQPALSGELTGTDTVSVSGPARTSLWAPPARRSAGLFAAVGGLGLIGGALIALWMLPTRSAVLLESAAAPRANAIASAAAPLPSELPAATAAEPEAPARTLSIVANAPITSVKLGGRDLPVDSPGTTVTVAIPAEVGEEARLVVVSGDGRKKGKDVTLVAGANEVNVAFAAGGARQSGTKMRRVYGNKNR